MIKKLEIYEYLVFISMIYIAIDLSSMVFAYKIIEIGPIIGAASSLIFPLTYSLMDIIAEVYGYKIAKKIILFSFICDFIFTLIVFLICQIPSINKNQTLAYTQVLGPLLRAFFAQIVGVISGAFINIHLISRWKIITAGKYFWLRSIGASIFGEGAMLVISVFIALVGVLTIKQILHLILYTYLYKIFFAITLAPLISILASFLKNKIQNQDSNFTNFNPFNISNNGDVLAESTNNK